MFRRILLAIDESGASERAMPAAAALATRFHGEVVVLEIPERSAGLEHDAVVSSETLGGPAPLTDRVVEDLKDGGVRARPELWMVCPDDPATSIADIATHEAADLLVIGARDGSCDRASGGTSGETLADRVLRLTGRPVLVLP